MNFGYILRRLLGAIPLLLGISLILFAIVHLAPGGPLDMYAENPAVSKEALQQIAVAYGLDKPAPVQYVMWLKSMLVGDWGYSIRTGRPVLTEIVLRLGPTLELGGLALLISLLLAVPLGIISAARRGSKLDSGLTMLSFAGISTPVFWLALLLQLLFSVQLGWLPSAGYKSIGDGSFLDRLAHIIMPATVLSLATIASWSRFIRSGMIDVLNQDYIRTAYAKGRSERGVIILHALRNAMIPAVTVIAVDFATVISGAVITETVFAWPGIGRLFMESMDGRDYPMLMGLMMMGSVGIVVANIIADVTYAALDPRIRYG
ncbi:MULTISPECIES: ABC transporter permease [Ensifer]|uniref:ABC transporter permease n=1 Tax=Ensifer TaxID=106591 RepID=UPI000713DCAC|nr:MULTISPECIES: ABC transporter permease [Ensifer]KQZ42723.1 diguanylate cyclase [Ensifer sp. Root558]MBD9496382.1 ABC transporter permease [Ensifer sp. ENS01]MBD9560215.1 ABC transporter permease [Ensifer sp. ENS03]MBD9595923.1 ABC transporter permease [Ensifer sp. ENS05]MBD9626438.1 ABC transporter permease [Ensifer sp. ENS06]